MNPTSGGQYKDDREKQRIAAAELARQNVLRAYKNTNLTKDELPADTTSAGNAPKNPKNWNDFHSAWSNYYQQYYHQYYTNAARDFSKKEAERVKTQILEEKMTEEQKLHNKIKKQASEKAQKIRKSKHFLPLVIAASFILFFLFMQYNRNLIAPVIAYISPGNASATEINEIDPTATGAINQDPTLIIPRLNVIVPIIFGVPSDNASTLAAMNKGVVHFSIPGANALPGEVGNLALSGHSASDIYNVSNQYKFIFAGLERLELGDLIYIDYEGIRYTYRMTKRNTVEPTNVQALTEPTTKPLITLITCTPIGTSRYRLLITAEQINPVPDDNTGVQPELPEDPDTGTTLPNNPPTFFENIWNWLTGNN